MSSGPANDARVRGEAAQLVQNVLMTTGPYRELNHFVPRLHLKRFACKPGLINHYPLLVSSARAELWREIAISKAAAQPHLYTVTKADGSQTDEAERWFDQEFEAPAEEALERAVSGQSLTRSHWRRLIRFWALQDLRTPRAYMAFMASFAPQLQTILDECVKDFQGKLAGSLEITDKANDRFELVSQLFPVRVEISDTENPALKKVQASAVAGRTAWVNLVRNGLRDDGPLRLLCGLKWTILTAPGEQRFFTSDVPTIKLHAGQVTGRHFEGVWGRPGTILAMPLSPRHLLYTQVGQRRPQPYTELHQESFHLVRRAAADHALRSIFSATRDPTIPELKPRTVDRHLFIREMQQREGWHAYQSKADRFEGSDSER